MVSYLDLLNKARARKAGSPLSATAVASNTGDALQGIAALNQAVNVFFENSYDLDSTEIVSDVTTIASTSVLTAPSLGWDSNVIKHVKWHRTGDDYLIPLTLLDLEQAEEIKLKTLSTNDPRYWYVNRGQINVLPVPTTGYTIKVFHQALQPDITSSNVTDTLIFEDNKVYNTLVDGIYAYLREAAGDPEWATLEQKFLNSVKRYYQRNKHTYKRQGFNTVRVKPKLGDRKL